MEVPLFEVAVPLRKLLTITECPPRWKHFDLYLFSDRQIAFYVGQSYCAFERVWEHIYGGPKGHSTIGRFLINNWPRSGGFTIGLLFSQSPRFAGVQHQLDAAERQLIEELAPCFNVSLNRSPAPLPPEYLPPNAPVKGIKSLKRMIREAGYAAKKDLSNENLNVEGWE